MKDNIYWGVLVVSQLRTYNRKRKYPAIKGHIFMYKHNYTVTCIFYCWKSTQCKNSHDNHTQGSRTVCHMCLRHLYWYACLNIILHSWYKALSKWHFLHGNSVYWKWHTLLCYVISRHLQPNELCPFPANALVWMFAWASSAAPTLSW